MWPKKPEKYIESVSKSAEKFTVDFHKSIAKTADGNFVSSAVSAHIVLSMAAYGAHGSTRKEMLEALHLPKNDEKAHRGFQALIDLFNTVENIVLKVANKIYASDRIVINEKFKKISSTYFRSESDTLDFSKNEQSADAINKWCAQQTNDKIKEIVRPDTLCSNTRMVLLNAVYFKGNWKYKFSESATKNEPFHVDRNTTIEVPTMITTRNFYFQELNQFNAEIVGLPYQNNDFYMLIIVPKEIDGLENLEKNLEQINVDFNQLRPSNMEICLSLPKFKVETTIDLNPHLKQLGMVEMFSDKANFKGLSNRDISVDQVVQKAYIEVNEEGTEAAAVTGMVCRVQRRVADVTFKNVQVDKPFIYQIVHVKSDTTLFSGHITNPIDT